MPRQPDFISQLERSELEQLEAFARKPGRTIDQCFDFLCADLGFMPSEQFPDHPRRVNRNSVWRWKRRFDEHDRAGIAADIADAVFSAQEATGNIDLVGANNLLVSQQIQRKLRDGKKLETKEIAMLAEATNKTATVEQQRIKIREHYENREAEAVKAAEAAEKSGKSAADVVSTIKQALGITA